MQSYYVNFKGSLGEYNNLHNKIKRMLPKPTNCSLCKITNVRFELANLSQKYTEDLNDWAYMCCPCHNRYDSKTHHWSEEGWKKRCSGCKEIKLLKEFYPRRGSYISRGKTFKRIGFTSWCRVCTINWAKEHYKKVKSKN